MTHVASAPVRLDFAGGWTDVEPFASERGGVVVNAAIERRVVAEVSAAQAYELRSEDLDLTVRPSGPHGFEQDGELDMLKASVRVSGIGPCRLNTRSDVPPGSGLGSSGALGVALTAALDAALGRGPGGGPELAERAWRLEAVEAALPGGKQDQYAAALGGFQLLRFGGDRVGVERLNLDDGVQEALAQHVIVCYTGQSRVSSHTIARVMTAFVRHDPTVSAALEGIRGVAERMADPLRRGNLSEVGRLLTANWVHQQALDSAMRTERMARLEAALAGLGVLGGKAAGAGAGGSMFFLISGDRAEAERSARAVGATVLPAAWAMQGVRDADD